MIRAQDTNLLVPNLFEMSARENFEPIWYLMSSPSAVNLNPILERFNKNDSVKWRGVVSSKHLSGVLNLSFKKKVRGQAGLARCLPDLGVWNSRVK